MAYLTGSHTISVHNVPLGRTTEWVRKISQGSHPGMRTKLGLVYEHTPHICSLQRILIEHGAFSG